MIGDRQFARVRVNCSYSVVQYHRIRSMNRKFQIRNLENCKLSSKGSLKGNLSKIPLECMSSVENRGGFISGMTLNEYFSSVRQNTQFQCESETSGLDLAQETAIREIDEENDSTYETETTQQQPPQSQRLHTKETEKSSLLKVKLPAIGHKTFAKLNKLEIPALSLDKKEYLNKIRSLYGPATFKRSNNKSKKQNLQNVIVCPFESKIKKQLLTRRDQSEVDSSSFALSITVRENAFKSFEVTSRRS